MSEKFQPEQYQDDVKTRMLEAIEQKVQGKEITLTPEEPQAKVIDLMEALKSSLGQGRRKPARKAEGAVKAAPARTSKKKS